MIVTADLATFERKTFRVKAVRITNGNMREIADWTGGEVIVRENRVNYLRIPCGSKKENRPAYPGDWVTNLLHYNDGEAPEEPNFRVYNNSTFLQAFREIMNEAEKYAKVHELVMKVRNAQDDATFYSETSEGVMLLIDQVTREICELV